MLAKPAGKIVCVRKSTGFACKADWSPFRQFLFANPQAGGVAVALKGHPRVAPKKPVEVVRIATGFPAKLADGDMEKPRIHGKRLQGSNHAWHGRWVARKEPQRAEGRVENRQRCSRRKKPGLHGSGILELSKPGKFMADLSRLRAPQGGYPRGLRQGHAEIDCQTNGAPGGMFAKSMPTTRRDPSQGAGFHPVRRPAGNQFPAL